MLFKILTLVASVAVALGTATGNAEEKHWALLVAGSNLYFNYRHQADICHAFHIMRNHGIPEEQIIVMMYDDIANNEQNPFKGNIINQPNGPNVYPGVSKDYTRGEVTPEVFLKVLTGDEDGVKKILGRNGKVIKSGPNDRIFVNFADHGAPGLVAFPNSFLYAKQLNDALNKMHQNKQYKQLVLYVEACESGSMFNKLLSKDINIYATTAANPHESSYACYYDDTRQTYLGDVYSVNWMQDSDKEDLTIETLLKQFQITKQETNTSHVQEYGDMSISKEVVGKFQGNVTGMTRLFKPSPRIDPNIGAIRSEDVELDILKRKGDHEGVRRVIERRDATRKFFKDVVKTTSQFDYYTLHSMPIHFSDPQAQCYQDSVEQIRKVCPGMNLVQNDYALRSLKVLVNLCETNIDPDALLAGIQMVSRTTPLCVSK